MKIMKVHKRGNKSVWYDFYIRMWTLQVNDEFGDQVGEVEYTASKKYAMEWLKK